MAKTPEVSVIMLTYNREKMLSGMIECILKQTMEDFEFIIVDNGSTDGSGRIAEEYAKKDQRIRVIHRDRGSIGSGRNTGLDNACGRFVAFVDDDDSCTEEYLAFLHKLITENDADVSICGATWSDRPNEEYLMTGEEAVEKLLQRKNYNVAFPTKMFKREVFDHYRFLEEGKYDDIYLMPLILANVKKVVYNGRSQYDFYRHEHNNSEWTQNHKLITPEILTEYLNVYRERTDYLCMLYPDKSDEWKYFNWSFVISMVEKVSRYELEPCYAIREELAEILSKHYAEFTACPWITDFEKDWMKTYIKEK